MADPRAIRRLRRNPAAWVSGAILLAVVLACVAWPIFLPAPLGEPGANQYAPPSREHPFGTDLNGRDQLYRVLTGGRISLLVGFCGAAVSLVIGAAWGLVAGYA
ncbi:MAG: ABC transporter permease, partial [Verrucomicrobiae bacterium]